MRTHRLSLALLFFTFGGCLCGPVPTGSAGLGCAPSSAATGCGGPPPPPPAVGRGGGAAPGPGPVDDNDDDDDDNRTFDPPRDDEELCENVGRGDADRAIVQHFFPGAPGDAPYARGTRLALEVGADRTVTSTNDAIFAPLDDDVLRARASGLVDLEIRDRPSGAVFDTLRVEVAEPTRLHLPALDVVDDDVLTVHGQREFALELFDITGRPLRHEDVVEAMWLDGEIGDVDATVVARCRPDCDICAPVLVVTAGATEGLVTLELFGGPQAVTLVDLYVVPDPTADPDAPGAAGDAGPDAGNALRDGGAGGGA